jgi:proliferating cell nuclear antigen PCNA
MNNSYIFKAKTKEAFVIKIIGELLANTLRFSQFLINEKGIFLIQPDSKKEQLIDLALYKENFNIFKCSRPILFYVNSGNLYKMLKSIKKKDSVTMFIEENTDDNLKLGICVEQEENNRVTTFIRINYYQPEEFDIPTGYDSPIIMNNKEFHKLKNLHNFSKTLWVIAKADFIKFYCDGGDLYYREVTIGNENNEETINFNKEYKYSFNTSYITGLTKCAGQSGNVQVFVHDDLPLKIKLKAGNLGDISIFIKSKEMIQDEADEADIETEELNENIENIDLDE